MLFVRTNDLKTGMRLAKPIYNKDGVLLYERNSKLSPQGIVSIHNFGLIGIYVLEPAEPVPPMTKDDVRFERFQTMNVFAIQEELGRMIKTRNSYKIQIIAANIISNYGSKSRKINFIQNLRSHDDYIYKHALNVSILCAMIAHAMNVKGSEQLDAVIAAIVHDIGKLLPNNSTEEESDKADMHVFRKGMELLEFVFPASSGIKNTCIQAQKAIDELKNGKAMEGKLSNSAKILLIAEAYDTMTSMHVNEEPKSEVAAIKTFLENKDLFDQGAVDGLIRSINILKPGTCIELNTGVKGVVLAGNEADVLRPMILDFSNNKVVDLSNRLQYKDLEIADIMKTMDNRHVMDMGILKKQGIKYEISRHAKKAEGLIAEQ